MSNEVKEEIIYITYRRYQHELKQIWPSNEKNWIKWRDRLLTLNLFFVSIFLMIGFLNIFGIIDRVIVNIYLWIEIPLLLCGAVIAIKADKIIYSDRVMRYKVEALNKVIPKDKYDEIIDILKIEPKFTVYSTIKDFLIKALTILSVGFGIIKPILEEIAQPFTEKLIEVSGNLSQGPWAQLVPIIGSFTLIVILILIAILLLWIAVVGLIRVYDKLITLFCLTSYAKSCELVTISILGEKILQDSRDT